MDRLWDRMGYTAVFQPWKSPNVHREFLIKPCVDLESRGFLVGFEKLVRWLKIVTKRFLIAISLDEMTDEQKEF